MPGRHSIVGSLLLLACLAGCGSPSTPEPPAGGSPEAGPGSSTASATAIAIRPLPSDIQPLPLDAPVTGSGFYPFDRWPAACDLLDDNALRAVFPQLTAIARKPGEVLFPGVAAPGTPPAPGPATVSVPGAGCLIALQLPDTVYRPDTVDGSGFLISLRVDAAGSEQVIALNKPAVTVPDGPGAQHAFPSGPATCVAQLRPVFRCATKHVAFSIALTTSEFDPTRDRAVVMRYQPPDGPPVEFRRDPAQGDELRRKWDFERSTVLGELANLAAVKVSN